MLTITPAQAFEQVSSVIVSCPTEVAQKSDRMAKNIYRDLVASGTTIGELCCIIGSLLYLVAKEIETLAGENKNVHRQN